MRLNKHTSNRKERHHLTRQRQKKQKKAVQDEPLVFPMRPFQRIRFSSCKGSMRAVALRYCCPAASVSISSSITASSTPARLYGERCLPAPQVVCPAPSTTTQTNVPSPAPSASHTTKDAPEDDSGKERAAGNPFASRRRTGYTNKSRSTMGVSRATRQLLGRLRRCHPSLLTALLPPEVNAAGQSQMCAPRPRPPLSPAQVFVGAAEGSGLTRWVLQQRAKQLQERRAKQAKNTATKLVKKEEDEGPEQRSPPAAQDVHSALTGSSSSASTVPRGGSATTLQQHQQRLALCRAALQDALRSEEGGKEPRSMAMGAPAAAPSSSSSSLTPPQSEAEQQQHVQHVVDVFLAVPPARTTSTHLQLGLGGAAACFPLRQEGAQAQQRLAEEEEEKEKDKGFHPWSPSRGGSSPVPRATEAVLRLPLDFAQLASKIRLEQDLKCRSGSSSSSSVRQLAAGRRRYGSLFASHTAVRLLDRNTEKDRYPTGTPLLSRVPPECTYVLPSTSSAGRHQDQYRIGTGIPVLPRLAAPPSRSSFKQTAEDVRMVAVTTAGTEARMEAAVEPQGNGSARADLAAAANTRAAEALLGSMPGGLSAPFAMPSPLGSTLSTQKMGSCCCSNATRRQQDLAARECRLRCTPSRLSARPSSATTHAAWVVLSMDRAASFCVRGAAHIGTASAAALQQELWPAYLMKPKPEDAEATNRIGLPARRKTGPMRELVRRRAAFHRAQQRRAGRRGAGRGMPKHARPQHFTCPHPATTSSTQRVPRLLPRFTTARYTPERRRGRNGEEDKEGGVKTAPPLDLQHFTREAQAAAAAEAAAWEKAEEAYFGVAFDMVVKGKHKQRRDD
eukprot:gene8834-6217_t